MDTDSPTLCRPDREKSCFACCPPIRPAAYEHVQYRSIIRRILRENTGAFDRDDERIVPITGFSCWALGYLDKGCRLVGCLLHPGQNNGLDLRYRVDYGEKCSREVCPEAAAFSALKPDECRFWLHLAEGLDAISYSSRRLNPLFELMRWGPRLLGLIAEEERYRPPSREAFLHAYPLFSSPLSPRAHAYLIRTLVQWTGPRLLKEGPFLLEFERFSETLSETLRRYPVSPGGDPVHRLDLDKEFCDFLRLTIPVRRLRAEDALRLKEIADRELDIFSSGLL